MSARWKRDPATVGRDASWLRLYRYALDLAKLPEIDFMPALRNVQQGVAVGDYDRAVSALESYFEKRRLDFGAKKPALDHVKFAELRETGSIPQKILATILSVSPSAVSQFENGGPSLRFMKVVVAAEAWGVSPAELIVGFVPKARLTDLKSYAERKTKRLVRTL
jgi:DNA-binding transcriptional regulator YiaG